MPYDLPDYEKRVVVVTVPGEYPSLMEVDVKKVDGVAIATPTVVGCLPVSLENVADVNLQKLLGATIKTPTVANCVPVSVEHTVDINHKQILGEALKTPTFANCVPTSIENDAIAYDAANDRFKVDLEKISATDILAVSATDLDIRALVSTDVVTVKSITDALPAGTNAIGKLAANSGVDIGDVDVKTMPDVTQSDETKLKATVTQAAKDRTISSVDATATPLQINITGLNGNSSALVTPASGKKIRVKFISLEHSAAVDIGYRFGAAGTIYYLRITAGVYVSNLIGCNNEGAADAALYLNSSGATNVKGYILYSEV